MLRSRPSLLRGTAAVSDCKAAARSRAVNLWKGFGLVASFSGGHASNIASGVDANRILYLGGVRYTRALPVPGDVEAHQAAAASLEEEAEKRRTESRKTRKNDAK
jgi:hypothetical protein